MSTNLGPGYQPSLGISSAAFTSTDAQSVVAVTDAPGANKYLVLHQIIVAIGASALTLDFKEETSGTLLFRVCGAANSTISIPFMGKLKLATANKKLTVTASGAGAVGITTFYVAEA